MRAGVVAAVLLALGPFASRAQTLAVDDPVLRAIWREGTEGSQAERIAQALLDSVGPRLTGSPGHRAGNDWAVAVYQDWGIEARNEAYGTWRGWRRGITHVDLVAPRLRTLEATMLAWSPGTTGPVEGPVVLLPELTDSAAFTAWLPRVQGAFVAVSFPQPTCRPDKNWEEFARPETLERMRVARAAALAEWGDRVQATGIEPRHLAARLEDAGAAGVLTSRWSEGWGVDKIFGTSNQRIPVLDVSCEDYGLVARLAERDQGPVLRVAAEAEFLGEVPVHNTIAEIRGRERPAEYVVLSAHFDSWDGASGATDNGTGTVVVMEAMRILETVLPQPWRSIVAAHWGGEEQGLNGSRAFTADHPEIVDGLQALFNQDNGTGRIETISAQGLVDAGGTLARWLARVPLEISGHIELQVPGSPGRGGSDYASFLCYGAPAFSLSSLSWDYGTYTWHTNRDTYDKIVFEEVRENAILMAMLAYLASEDPERVPRTQRTVFPVNQATGEAMRWPECEPPERSSAEEER
jgi:hypothetical protein